MNDSNPLGHLGYDSWFHRERDRIARPDLSAARITRVDRDRFLVRNETGEVQAEPTGKFLFFADTSQELPCVGDWVLVQYFNDGTLAIIHELLPRKTHLCRKAAGKNSDIQMIAANIDTAFIMQSCDHDFNLRRLERYLVIAHEGRIEPVILLSKSDLVDAGELDAMITEIRNMHIDAGIIPFSSTTGNGMEEVRRAMKKGKTYCLLGSSGVGKTTLLNHLLGSELFETAPVREKDSRGRHTTSRRQMILLDTGALVIDTPGMRELGMPGVDADIIDSFADIHDLASGCRFKDCTHTTETGCVILKALETGDLSAERYESYLKLRKEAEYHQLSYVEKRKKDKRFGKMMNVAMKQLKHRKP